MTTETVCFDFDSLDAFMRAADARPPESRRNNREEWDEIRNRARGDFYGLPAPLDFNGVTKVVRSGWSDGVARMTKALGQISAQLETCSVRRRLVWGDAGDELDQQRVWSGALDRAWRGSRRTSTRQPPRVRLISNMTVSGGTDADVIFWRGAAILRMADLLQEAGYNVEICSMFRARALDAARTEFRTLVTVKDYQAPLDLPAVASATAFPAFFRCIGFLQVLTNLPHDNNSPGIAVPVTPTANDVKAQGAERVFLVPETVCDARSATDWLVASLAALDPHADEQPQAQTQAA